MFLRLIEGLSGSLPVIDHRLNLVCSKRSIGMQFYTKRDL